jgi:hypothetical protein
VPCTKILADVVLLHLLTALSNPGNLRLEVAYSPVGEGRPSRTVACLAYEMDLSCISLGVVGFGDGFSPPQCRCIANAAAVR